MKTLEELYNEILADEGLKEQLKAAAKENKVEEFFKAQGCEATIEEVKEFINSKKEVSLDEKYPYCWLLLGLILTLLSYGIFNTGICAWIFATSIIPMSIQMIDDHFGRILIYLRRGMANIHAQIPVLKIP